MDRTCLAPRAWLLVLVASVMAMSACAARQSERAQGEAVQAGSQLEPPRMLSPTRPSLPVRVWSGEPGARERREALRITARLTITAAGDPELGHLVLTGPGGSEHRASIIDWLERSTFRPAMRDGMAVPGTLVLVIRRDGVTQNP